jgi:hypothetical protein
MCCLFVYLLQMPIDILLSFVYCGTLHEKRISCKNSVTLNKIKVQSLLFLKLIKNVYMYLTRVIY